MEEIEGCFFNPLNFGRSLLRTLSPLTFSLPYRVRCTIKRELSEEERAHSKLRGDNVLPHQTERKAGRKCDTQTPKSNPMDRGVIYRYFIRRNGNRLGRQYKRLLIGRKEPIRRVSEPQAGHENRSQSLSFRRLPVPMQMGACNV